MKNKGFVIIGFIVVLALIVGVCFLIFGNKENTTGDSSLGNFFDNIFDDNNDGPSDSGSSDDNSSGSNSSGGSSSGNSSSGGSSSGSIDAARYIAENGYGYQTIGEQTVFFGTYSFLDEYISKPNVTSYINFDSTTTKAYGNFVVNAKWSYDGIQWNDFSNYKEITDIETRIVWSSKVDHTLSDKIYVSYTFVDNCVNPMEVFADLNKNVFEGDVRFSYYIAYDGDVGGKG